MGSPINYFVDPSLGSNTGDGTVGTPWGRASGSVVQHALNTISQNATHGDRVNVKSGADDVLTASLDYSTYGVPGIGAPCVIAGYTSAAYDGGQGSISGGGSVRINASNPVRYTHFQDLKLHNTGANYVVSCSKSGVIKNCEITNSTGGGIYAGNTESWVFCNYVHDTGGNGIYVGDGSVLYNYLKNTGSNDFAIAINFSSGSRTSICEGNIISVDGASDGILASDHFSAVIGNSILSNGGTGQGIRASNTNHKIISNLIEGFSGAGGIGIDSAGADEAMVISNAVFNCATKYNPDPPVSMITLDGNDNESLVATLFAKSGSDTFANRFSHFAPSDVGNLWGGAFPVGSRRDKGAVQHAAAGGTSGFPLSRSFA